MLHSINNLDNNIVLINNIILILSYSFNGFLLSVSHLPHRTDLSYKDVPNLFNALVRVQSLSLGQLTQECQVDVQQSVQLGKDAVNHVFGQSNLIQHAVG